jgi:hypothetical protein
MAKAQQSNTNGGILSRISGGGAILGLGVLAAGIYFVPTWIQDANLKNFNAKYGSDPNYQASVVLYDALHPGNALTNWLTGANVDAVLNEAQAIYTNKLDYSQVTKGYNIFTNGDNLPDVLQSKLNAQQLADYNNILNGTLNVANLPTQSTGSSIISTLSLGLINPGQNNTPGGSTNANLAANAAPPYFSAGQTATVKEDCTVQGKDSSGNTNNYTLSQGDTFTVANTSLINGMYYYLIQPGGNNPNDTILPGNATLYVPGNELVEGTGDQILYDLSTTF